MEDKLWSPFEDSMLMLCARLYANKWHKIAQVYNYTDSPYLYRSDNALRNRHCRIRDKPVDYDLTYYECVVIFTRLLSCA